MRDLEIRGAGSLLGEIQHGHMEQVGYDTYCNLLDQVVKEMQGIEIDTSEEEQRNTNRHKRIKLYTRRIYRKQQSKNRSISKHCTM